MTRALAAGRHHSVACRADGTAVAVGNTKAGERDVLAWSDVVATGNNADGRCEVTGQRLL